MPDLLRLRQPHEDIARLRQIAEILLRNGLGFLAEQLDLTRLLPPWRQARLAEGEEVSQLTIPERVRCTIEELVDEFARTLRSELDVVNEGRNADRLRHNLQLAGGLHPGSKGL